MLLIGAGLLIRSMGYLRDVDPGFNPRNLVTLQLSAPPARYDTSARRAGVFQQVTDRLSGLPGVQSVSAINHLPLAGDLWTLGYEVVGRPSPPPGQGFGAVYRVVRAGYFQTMEIPILQGRDFTYRDNERTPAVVVINEIFSRRQWPDESPLGKQILYSEGNRNPLLLTIVGVVGNARQSDWTSGLDDEVYLPYSQRPSAFGLSYLTFVIRSATSAEALAGAIRKEIWSIDRNLPVSLCKRWRR